MTYTCANKKIFYGFYNCMINSSASINNYIKQLPNSIKDSKYPLSKLDTKFLEGIQSGIPLFQGEKHLAMNSISFLSTRFETLNLFRGCTVGCSHCLKDAQANGHRSILFEDLERFLNGFKTLNERLGFNVFNGNKYLSIVDDSNPSDFPILGKDRKHSVVEAIEKIYEKLNIPILFVTSGWNKGSGYAQKASEELANAIQKNPSMIESVDISINPFVGILEKSREASKNNNQDKADFLRNVYTSRMANVLATFLNAFASNKAQIIYRHAPNAEGNELVNEVATKKLYEEIYTKLRKLVGSAIDNIPQLKPEELTRFDKSRLIESSGRGRQFFSSEINLREQEQLIDEAIEWECLSNEEKFKTLNDYALKCVDIDGSVYATMPSNKVDYISAPIELTVSTDIKLNYENKIPTKPIFSDIDF